MSERDQNQSVSQAVQELSAKVETWEAQLAGWGTVISEELVAALKQGAKQAEERAREQARTWAAEQERRMQPLLTTLASAGERQVSLGEELAGQTHNLHVLTSWLEALHTGWVWGLSRQQWKGLIVTVGVTLIVVTVYLWGGPAAQERARLEKEIARLEKRDARWAHLWANTSEGGKAGILKRAGGEPPQ